MSRTAHFLVGMGILALCAVWCFGYFVALLGTAIGLDPLPGTSIYDPSFMMLHLVGAGALICGLWFAVRSFRRALNPSQLESPAPPASPEQKHNHVTRDEKSADLAEKTEI